jgi:ABC-type antimicrobial peptide transport system permease subunit
MMAYVVSLRTRELGVRVALGASPRDLLRLVVGETLGLTVRGLLIGMLLALPVAYAIRATLVGVSFVDPLSLIPVIAILLAVALLAAFVPARRAASIDPALVLRRE